MRLRTEIHYSPESLINQLKRMDPSIDKLSWIKRQNQSLMLLNDTFNLAAENGLVEIIILLSKIPGIDPTTNKNYAICNAALNGHKEVIDFLCTLPCVDPAAHNSLALRWAAERGHVAIVKSLCSIHGVNPAADNSYAIRLAAYYGHLDTVIFLSTCPNVKPNAGKHSALREAVARGHSDVAEYLASLPCYNPFAQNIDFEKKKEIILLLADLNLHTSLTVHQAKANSHLGFLFFNNDSNMDELIKDVKEIIARNALDIDHKSMEFQ